MALELNLSGKKALITGASEGIGRAIAERFGAEKIDLYLAARNGDKLSELADLLRREHGVDVVTMPGDLSQDAQRKAVAERAADADILVNNAGAIPAGNILDIDDAKWRAAWELKIFGYVNLTREFYRRMKARRSGVIINVIGAGGEKPAYEYIAGSTGNAALMAFTRALGGHAPVDGVRVVGINPGPVETERLVTVTKKAARARFGDESKFTELWRNFPFGRAASVMEIADMAVFLASDLSAYTSGTIITIDGGSIYKGNLF